MALDRLFILDVNDGMAAGLLCEAGKRSLAPVASACSTTGSGKGYHQAVEEVIQRCGAGDCSCYMALPVSMFYFKNLTLPFTDQRKIAEILHHELLGLVSFGDEPFVYDTVVIETTDSVTRLLAAVIPQAELAPWYEILGRHGLTPTIVTFSPLGRLAQICGSEEDVQGSFVYLDAGHQESSFFHIATGDIFRIDTIRRLAGAADGVPDELRDGFMRTFRTLEARGGEDAVTAVKIGGSAAERLGTDWIGDHMECSVEIVDSEQLGVSSSQALQMLPLYLVPRLWGMAALKAGDPGLLNVIKRGTTRPTGMALIKKFGPVLLLLCAVCGLVAGYQLYEYQKLSSTKARLVKEAETIYSQTLGGKKPVADPVAELKARISEIDESVVAAIVENPEISSVALLSDISKRLPTSVSISFDRFSFDREKVRIDGVTGAYNDVDAIKRSLEESPYYTGVSIDSAGSIGDGAGVKFSITLLL